MANLDLSKEWDFVIIGGGLSGLGCGAILANGNKKVLILEKDAEIGGRARPSQKDGFILDNGLHLIKFGKESALMKILQLSNSQADTLELIPIKNYYVYIGLDDEHLKKTLSAECINKNAWTRKGWLEVPCNVNIMRGCDYFSIWKLMRIYTTCFKCEYNDIKAKSLRSFLAEKKMCKAFGCVEIERYLKFISTATMHISDPRFISAGEIFRTLKRMSKMDTLYSYPKGGWMEIIKRLRHTIESNGGQIITNCAVKQLVIENNKTSDQNAILDPYKVTGVIADLGKIKSKNVIIAIPPKYLPSLFVDKVIIRRLVPEYQKIIEKLEPVSGISIDFALNTVLYKSKTFMYVESPPGYGATISNIDPSICPEGKQLMSFFFPFPYQMLKMHQMIDDLITQCKNGIYANYPKIKGNVLFERVLIHEHVDSVQVDINHYWDTRPRPKVPGIEGCFITGDYLRSYGASGELAYNSVLDTCDKIKKIENEFYL